MKKLLALLLVLAMVMGLVACGGTKTEETKAPEAAANAEEAAPAEEKPKKPRAPRKKKTEE